MNAASSPPIADAHLDQKIQEFYDIHRIIKNLEAINKQNRHEIGVRVCRTEHRRRTTESVRDGWVYDNGTHCCTIRQSIRHYIDKERLPRDVYQLYGQLQEVVAMSVVKCGDRDDDGEADVSLLVDFAFGTCAYNASPRRRRASTDAVDGVNGSPTATAVDHA